MKKNTKFERDLKRNNLTRQLFENHTDVKRSTTYNWVNDGCPWPLMACLAMEGLAARLKDKE